MLKDMLPQPKQELSTDNIAKFNAGVQSLEETVRANNPDKSEEWVQEEIQRIEDDKSSTDSMAQMNGAMNLQQINNSVNFFLC
jgi:HPt (histidine-containing phosphotransfer) domain-containing protein